MGMRGDEICPSHCSIEMKQEDLTNFINSLDVNEFSHYFQRYGEKATVIHYNISYGNLREVRKQFSISVDKNIILQNKKKCWKEKSTSSDNSMKVLVKRIPLEEINEYYEKENHTLKESASHFGTSYSKFVKLLSFYNFHKSKEAHSKKIAESKQYSHNNATYNNREKAKQTCLEKYGVMNPFESEELMSNTYEVKCRNNGVSNPK